MPPSPTSLPSPSRTFLPPLSVFLLPNVTKNSSFQDCFQKNYQELPVGLVGSLIKSHIEGTVYLKNHKASFQAYIPCESIFNNKNNNKELSEVVILGRSKGWFLFSKSLEYANVCSWLQLTSSVWIPSANSMLGNVCNYLDPSGESVL